jgi:translation initiation factor 2B subunit (eIF-2B alpha/beta/delta family)/8-oxo-dGTP pyrophosphatase MutT (NUDIX family)
MEKTHVVTCFLRNGTDVLLFRRSDEVGSYAGRWGAVAGHAEGDPNAAAERETRQETGLDPDSVERVRAGESFSVEDEDLGTRWFVHPYLFECTRRDVVTNWKTEEYEWVPPTRILRRETVPDLWMSYRRVAPSVATVSEDTSHGSAYISIRALEVLRDRGAELAAGHASPRDDTGPWDDLASLARDLLDARPGMAAVRTRGDRVMNDASDDRTPTAVEEAASVGIERALRANEEAAANAAGELGATALTLSRSGTVATALRRGVDRVFIAESRPAREGVGTAEGFADAGLEVTLCVDAAVAHVLAAEPIDAVVVGADTVLPDGAIVNKVGTRLVALAAAREGVPVYAVAAGDKVSVDDCLHLEFGADGEVYDGDARIDVVNPTFDVTPGDLVTAVVTEDGMFDADDVGEIAETHRSLADWRS